ncbi:oxidoreductase [Subtercola lobariae]|uniref:Oxidoreductase n=2 Tax=Subtercola lobariae TaxID=1588641 RepID=A0A917B3Q4_9MICO|nr:oxidoreductase [Subtercola lobariae]
MVTLNNGVEIPQLGFGVFQVPVDEAQQATLSALEVGYRHIDTAQSYRNEKQVGLAVVESGLPRSEVFVTSKLGNGFHAPTDARWAFERTLGELGFDYLDLFLIDWPADEVADFVETWQVFEELLASCAVRAIGVSNFQPQHLERLLAATDVIPAVNQIEVHPYFTQDALREQNRANGIATEAWSPIAQGKVLGDETIGAIAARHGKTPAQVTLRWHIQRGDIVFPKSTTPARVAENFDLFDFELSDDDVTAITALNRDDRTGPNPDTMNMVPDRQRELRP